MEPKELLQEVVAELIADEEWQLPAQMRVFLQADLEWSLLAL